MLFHCIPVNQQNTSIFALILWPEEQRLNRFWSEKKVPKLYFHFWPPKKCPPFFFLIHTWWCENITASPCADNSRECTYRCGNLTFFSAILLVSNQNNPFSNQIGSTPWYVTNQLCWFIWQFSLKDWLIDINTPVLFLIFIKRP